MSVDKKQYKKDKEKIHERINILENSLNTRFDTLDKGIDNLEKQIKELRKMIYNLQGSQETQRKFIPKYGNGKEEKNKDVDNTTLGEVKGMTQTILTLVLNVVINLTFMVAILKILGVF